MKKMTNDGERLLGKFYSAVYAIVGIALLIWTEAIFFIEIYILIAIIPILAFPRAGKYSLKAEWYALGLIVFLIALAFVQESNFIEPSQFAIKIVAIAMMFVAVCIWGYSNYIGDKTKGQQTNLI